MSIISYVRVRKTFSLAAIKDSIMGCFGHEQFLFSFSFLLNDEEARDKEVT